MSCICRLTPRFRDISHVINDSMNACFCFLLMHLQIVLSELDPTSIQAMGIVTWPDNNVHSSPAQCYWCMQINVHTSHQGPQKCRASMWSCHGTKDVKSDTCTSSDCPPVLAAGQWNPGLQGMQLGGSARSLDELSSPCLPVLQSSCSHSLPALLECMNARLSVDAIQRLQHGQSVGQLQVF